MKGMKEPPVHAGTSNVPEGAAGTEADAALLGFHCSFLLLQNRKGVNRDLETPVSPSA
ncbi:hypothetical protein PAMP_006268 [Pampus punctatissimus]